MTTVTIQIMVDEDRRLNVDLPKDVPIGPAELVIRSLADAPAHSADLTLEQARARLQAVGALGTTHLAPPDAVPLTEELTREQIRARLKAAGVLSTARYAPPDAVPLTPEERERLGRLFASERPISDLIDEDRNER